MITFDALLGLSHQFTFWISQVIAYGKREYLDDLKRLGIYIPNNALNVLTSR